MASLLDIPLHCLRWQYVILHFDENNKTSLYQSIVCKFICFAATYHWWVNSEKCCCSLQVSIMLYSHSLLLLISAILIECYAVITSDVLLGIASVSSILYQSLIFYNRNI